MARLILLDTSVLSTFARIGEVDLLLSLFAGRDLGVTPAVRAELAVGLARGYTFLADVLDLTESGRVMVTDLSPAELAQRVALPRSLSEGEAQSVAVCRSRGVAFVTNDQRAGRFCRSAKVTVVDLIDILRSLWRLGLRSKEDVARPVAEVEMREGTVFKGPERIFAEP